MSKLNHGTFIEKTLLGNAASAVKADLVVYGKIFTSENNQIVEAFAVKDGKYIYVGDKAGAENFIEKDKTEIIDYTGKGLVMPSCGNGHAHYLFGHSLQLVGTIIDLEDSVEKFLAEIVPAAVKKAKDSGSTVIFGFGWSITEFPKNMPTVNNLTPFAMIFQFILLTRKDTRDWLTRLHLSTREL